jgi:putative phosphoesterase
LYFYKVWKGKIMFLVISDSHGNIPALKAALRWTIAEAPALGLKLSAALFLGDGAEDLSRAGAETGFSLPWYKVRGNGDMNFSIPESLVLSIDPAAGAAEKERRIFLTHGNYCRIELGYEGIASAAAAAGAGIALFGHTHVPCLEYSEHGGILLLNPGSIGRPRSSSGPSFATLEVAGSTPPTVRFWGLTESRRKCAIREIFIAD